MLNFRNSKTISLAVIVAVLFCCPASAQQQADSLRRTSEPARQDGVERSSDLTQENLGRVAASAVQIRSVLVKNEGLMVELKRWVAKEATDNGQIVEDSKLTDRAFFERLEQDITFR